jgi:hypothetical protein
MILFSLAAVAWGQAAQPLRLEKTIDLPEVQGDELTTCPLT